MSNNKIYYKFKECYLFPLSTANMITCITVKGYNYIKGIVYFENIMNKTLWLLKWDNDLRDFYSKHRILRDPHLDYQQLPEPKYMYDKYNNLIREIYVW